MARVIAYRTKQGKLNTVVVGDDVRDSTLMVANQGFERKAGVERNREATLKALQTAPTEYMTYQEYQAFLRLRRRKARK